MHQRDFAASSTGMTSTHGTIKAVHPRGGDDVDGGRPTCQVAEEAEPSPGVGADTSNGTRCLDMLWRGRPYRLGAYRRIAIETGRVDGEAFENYSAALPATGLMFMVGLRACDGVMRPPRYQSKAKIKGFHLVSPRGTFSHVGDTII